MMLALTIVATKLPVAICVAQSPAFDLQSGTDVVRNPPGCAAMSATRDRCRATRKRRAGCSLDRERCAVSECPVSYAQALSFRPRSIEDVRALQMRPGRPSRHGRL